MYNTCMSFNLETIINAFMFKIKRLNFMLMNCFPQWPMVSITSASKRSVDHTNIPLVLIKSCVFSMIKN